MRFPATPGWGPLVVVVVGPSPLLAEGPRGSSLPFLAGFACGGGVAVSCTCVGVSRCGCWSLPFSRALGCVCVFRVASCRCGCCVGFVCAGLAACVCVCPCSVWCQVCGLWGMSYLF